MNIMMQTCGLLVVIFLFILYKSHKTLHLPSEKVFSVFMLVAFLCLFLDGLSIVAIHYRNVLPEWLWKLSCKSYIISLMWVGFINLSYVSIDLNRSPQKHHRADLILACVTAAESILVSWLPIDVYENGREVYSFGPAVITVYICTLLYIFSILGVAIYISQKGSKRRGFAVIITTCIWILSAVIQFLRNDLLLVGFAEAIGVMILYIVMENPDGNLDKRLGCFNSNAYHDYLDIRFQLPGDFSLLSFSLSDMKDFEDDRVNDEATARKLISQLLLHDDLLLFKNDVSNFSVICEDAALLEQIKDEIVNMGTTLDLHGGDLTVYMLGNGRRFRTSTELLNFSAYLRESEMYGLSSVVTVSEEMIRDYRNIGVLKKEIDAALEEDRVEVFMQPIYSNTEKKIVSAEALVRIRKPEGGHLSPGIFIPVAESTGQITMLGERVLEKVCRFIKDNDIQRYGLRTIDVNLSAVQCDDNNMAGRICQIVDTYGVNSGLINFEITETAVSRAKDILLENMEALVSKGFSFALDDFGKGESNLIYIVEMPVKFIKLDIEMSKAFFSNQKAKHVVASISEMAKRIGLPIVAEGIETKEEVEGIRNEGIQFIQGNYYSHPLAMDDFLRFLENFKSGDPEPEIIAECAGQTPDKGGTPR